MRKGLMVGGAALVSRSGREAVRWTVSTLAAVALAGTMVPSGLLADPLCCAGREDGAGDGEDRPVTAEDVERVRTVWERVATAAQLSLDELDRSRFELRALQLKLGTDPETIFAWVRDNTRWVPYEGALKGARGVLLARQGNTLDRALLLARLFELAGHSVRIANGAATERRRPELEQAARASMNGTWRFQSAGDGASTGQRLADVAEKLGLSTDELKAETARVNEQRVAFERQLDETTDVHLEALRGLLMGEELPLANEGADQPDAVQNALKQHYWVQVMTAENTWKDYDLFFESGVLPGLVVIQGAPFLPSEVPNALLHTVTLRVVAAADDAGGKRTERVPLEYVATPAEHGVGEFVLSFVDLDAQPAAQLVAGLGEETGAEQLLQRMAARSQWVPVISFPDGGEPVAQSGFNASGDLIPDPLAVGQTVGSRVAAGTSLLETLGTQPPAATPGNQLAEVRIEIATSSPGADAMVERRVVYRRASEPGDDEGWRRAAALGRTTHLLVQTGSLPAALMRFVNCERLLSINLAMRFLLSDAEEADKAEVTERAIKVVEKTDTLSPALYALAASRQAREDSEEQYYARPNVLGFVQEWKFDGEKLARREWVDLMMNNVESLPDGGLDPFWANLRAGVFDSVLESEAHLTRRSGLSTSRAFAEGASSWRLIKSADDPQFAGWKAASETARDAVRADLARGHWVVLNPVAEQDRAAWWRVDPRTGAALGMAAESGSAGGAAMPEWLIVGLRVIIAVGMHFKHLYGCIAGGPSSGAGVAVCVGCVLVLSYLAIASIAGAIGGGVWDLGVDVLGAGCEVAGGLLD